MKTNKYYVFKILQSLIAIIGILYCLYGEVPESYKNMVWVPFAFFIVINILKNKKNYDTKNIAIIAIDVLATLKYAIIPIIMIMYDDFAGGVLTGHIPSKYYIDKAIILQVIEIITVYIMLFLYRNKTKDENVIKVHKIGKIIIAFCVVGLVVALIYWKNFIPSQFFVIDTDYVTNSQNDIEYSSGAIPIILNVFKTIMLIIGIQYFYKKYQEHNRMLYILGAGMVLLIYIALSTGMSRWAIVFPFLTCTYLFFKMFGKKAKVMMGALVLVVCVSIISISFVKFQWLLNEDSTFEDLFRVYAKQMQEYFSGIRATAQGVETAERYKDQITFKTMINDFTGSIPIVSHYVDQQDRINIYYNYLLKGTMEKATQIMPMITIGYAYFDYPLSWIFVGIHIFIALKLGEQVKKTQDIFKKYIYCLFVFWFTMCLGFNTQIIFGNVLVLFIPFMLLIKVDDILLKRKEDKKL